MVSLGTDGRPLRDEAAAQAAAAGEEEEAGAAAGPYASASASASLISSTSQSGTRVGRRLTASTQACAVQPSAIVSPLRSTTYS